MFSLRLRTAFIVALVAACSDAGSTTSAETSATTAATEMSDSTDWTGDLTTPTTAADPTSTTGTSEVDTTTGEPLVCITSTGQDTAGEAWTYSYGIPSEQVRPDRLIVAPDGSITTALQFRGEIDLGAGLVDTHNDDYRF